jgi:hypothetical protein
VLSGGAGCEGVSRDSGGDSGNEDLWLSYSGETLILERTDGPLRRVPGGFWNNVEDD